MNGPNRETFNFGQLFTFTFRNDKKLVYKLYFKGLSIYTLDYELDLHAVR